MKKWDVTISSTFSTEVDNSLGQNWQIIRRSPLADRSACFTSTTVAQSKAANMRLSFVWFVLFSVAVKAVNIGLSIYSYSCCFHHKWLSLINTFSLGLSDTFTWHHQTIPPSKTILENNNKQCLMLRRQIVSQSSVRRQKGLTCYCFKYIDRPVCLQTDALFFLVFLGVSGGLGGGFCVTDMALNCKSRSTDAYNWLECLLWHFLRYIDYSCCSGGKTVLKTHTSVWEVLMDHKFTSMSSHLIL